MSWGKKPKKEIVSQKLHIPIQIVHSDALQAIYQHTNDSELGGDGRKRLFLKELLGVHRNMCPAT